MAFDPGTWDIGVLRDRESRLRWKLQHEARDDFETMRQTMNELNAVHKEMALRAEVEERERRLRLDQRLARLEAAEAKLATSHRFTPTTMTATRVGKSTIVFTGLAATYFVPGKRGTEYKLFEDTDVRIIERIQRGAFKSCLRRSDDVRFVAQHDPGTVMARTTAGTLKLRETNNGLEFTAHVDAIANQFAKTLESQVERGDVTACSFAFSDPSEDVVRTKAADGKRTLFRNIMDFGNVSDVCGVTYPAYQDTWIRILERKS